LAKKRLAAKVLGVGISRIRFDPQELEAVEDAITRSAVRGLIKDGVIRVEQSRGISKGRHRIRKKVLRKRGRGGGSKEGAKGARMSRKERWVGHVRVLRKTLKALKAKGEITRAAFNALYKQVKGGQIRSSKHLKELAAKMGRTGGLEQ